MLPLESVPLLDDAVLVRSPIADLDDGVLPGLDTLTDVERTLADGHGPRRRREIVAGRAALRRALGAIGWSGAEALGVGPRGEPLVPSGFTGSLSHKDGLAIAIAARSSGDRTIGVDTEVLGTRERCSIASRVLRPDELDRWAAGGSTWAELLLSFSIKEAIYKALHPHVPRYIDFLEAELHADGRIELHLATGTHPFALRSSWWWESDRLITVVEVIAQKG